MLLGLIVWIYNSTQRIPDNRIELYGECAELLFRRWDNLKQLDPDIPDPHWLFLLVTEIAHDLYLLTSEEGESNEEWLKERVYKFFCSVYDGDANNRARAAAEKFVKHLIGRSWILHERSSGIFEFTHRTFLEYFFARWLDDEYDGLEAFSVNMCPRIMSGEWTIPIHLACQLKTAGKRRSAKALIGALLATLNSELGAERKCFPLLRFIVDSILYLQPSEPTMVRIVRALIRYVETKAELHWILGGVVKLPRSYNRSIIEGIVYALADEISRPSRRKDGVIIDWLYAIFLSARNRHRIQFPGFDLKLDNPHAIFGMLIADLCMKADDTPSRSKVLFDLCGIVAEAETTAGLAMWADSIFPSGRLDWRIVDFGLGILECVDVLLGVAEVKECPYFKLFSVLAAVIHEQAGYPIWGGDVLTVSMPVRYRLMEAVANVEGSPFVVACALAISLAGFVELTVGWDAKAVSRTDCEFVLEKILRRTDVSAELARFLKDWIGGRTRIFSPSVAPRVSCEEAFRGWDEGKTHEGLRVTVEVRRELVPS